MKAKVFQKMMLFGAATEHLRSTRYVFLVNVKLAAGRRENFDIRKYKGGG